MSVTEEPPAAVRAGRSTRRAASGAYARAVEQAEALDTAHVIELAFRRHYRAIVRVCRERCGDPSRAEDLAQETLIRALRYGHRVDATRPLLPWLRTIAVRVVIDDAALAANQRETIIDLTDHCELVDDDFSATLGEHPELSTAYRRLSSLHQTALRLRYLEDWSSADTARFLGISRDACDQLVARAKVRLKAHLERLGKTHPALAPLAGGGWLTRIRVAVAQRRAGVTGWDATLTSFGAVAENLAVAIALSIAATTLPTAAADELAGGSAVELAPIATVATTSQPAPTTAAVPGNDAGHSPLAGASSESARGDGDDGDGSESHYRIDGPVQEAPPTTADARISETDEDAYIVVEAHVTVMGHKTGVDSRTHIPCDRNSRTLTATCQAIRDLNHRLNGDEDPEAG